MHRICLIGLSYGNPILFSGLLYHYFYALPKQANPNTYDLLKLLDDQELNSHGLVHFYGDRKPWGDNNKELPEFVKSAQARWHQVHRSLKRVSTNSLPKFSSPLTEVGAAEYLKQRVMYDSRSGKSNKSPKRVSTNSLPKFSSPLIEEGAAEYLKQRVMYDSKSGKSKKQVLE